MMQPIQLGPFTLGATGATMNIAPTLEQFAMPLEFSLYTQRYSPWWIGDLVNWAEGRFGDDAQQALPNESFSCGLIERSRSVAAGVKLSIRRPELSFSHHREVACLSQALQQQALAYAVERNLTSGELRKHAKMLRLQDTMQ